MYKFQFETMRVTQIKPIHLDSYFMESIVFCLMGCGAALKESPPAVSLETFSIVATKLEYRAMRNSPCTPHYRTAQNEQSVTN